MKHYLFLLIFIPIVGVSQPSQTITYKTVDTVNLDLEVLTTSTSKISKHASPAIIFFFGGGWNSGTIEQFRPHAEYFVKRGMVAILADYRVQNRHHVPPFESLKDAKSAIRFVRENAKKWGIDPHKIVASGGSAGGHLASATALIEKYNDSQDNLNISCIPDALVLFNPVIDNGPGGYGFERIQDEYKDFSPIHNIREGLPPTIFFLGTNDALIPVETAQYYKTMSERTDNRCDLHLYEGAGHGFFNLRNKEFYSDTIDKTDLFLQSIGFIDENKIHPLPIQ